MSVLFCHDHRFIIDADGAVYSRGQFTEAIVARYERVFGQMFIAGRMMPLPAGFEPARFNRVFEDTSRFVSIPSLSSVKSLLLGDPVAERRLEEAMWNVDAVIVRLPSEIGLLAGTVAPRMGKPLITEVVGCIRDGLLSHGSFAARSYVPLATRRMRRAVARSEWTLYVTRGFLQRRYPSGGEQASLSNVQLPHRDEAVLPRRLGKIAGSDRPLVFGMVAAMFHNEKGVDVAIRALAHALDSGVDARLEIVGPGETETLEALAQRLSVTDEVRFLGVLPAGEPIFSFLDGVDVYVQTSFQEGLPRGMIEAMSRALPALGSNAGGTNELLPDDWLHAPGDSATLAGQMLRVRDPAVRVRLAEENFARAADFTVDKLDARRTAFWERFCEANDIVVHTTVQR